MSNTQQYSAFNRTRQIVDPNTANALASFQHMNSEAEACPIHLHSNPISYNDLHVPDPTCSAVMGTVGSVFEADETLQGGSYNPNGLSQYGVMRFDNTPSGVQPNYLHQ